MHSKRCHLSWPIAVEHSVHSCMITNHYTLRWIYIIVCRTLFVLYCRSLSLQFRLPLWCFIPFVEYPSLELSKLKTDSVPFVILVCMVGFVLLDLWFSVLCVENRCLSFFVYQWCCMSFFNWWLLITPLVSLNFS